MPCNISYVVYIIYIYIYIYLIRPQIHIYLSLQVETPLRDFKLLCPRTNSVGDPFTCNVTFTLGSNVRVKVDLKDGTRLTLTPAGQTRVNAE